MDLDDHLHNQSTINLQDAVYGKGNEGPLKTVLKRKAEQESTDDLDAKVRNLAPKCTLPRSLDNLLIAKVVRSPATGRLERSWEAT